MIFFRDSDRVGSRRRDSQHHLRHVETRLAEPQVELTPDPAENRRWIPKLAALEPSLILPGHGPEVTDMGAFQRFAAGLPALFSGVAG